MKEKLKLSLLAHALALSAFLSYVHRKIELE
jgi:hypothetical protein